MKEQIQIIIDSCPGGKRDYLEASEWLTDKDLLEIESLIDQSKGKYAHYLRQCIKVLGTPTYNESTHRDQIDTWYPESIRISCWVIGAKTFFLSLEHQDRDTPVGILIGCLSNDEIEELKN